MYKQLMQAWRIATVLIVAFGAASCATVQVGSDYDRSASFANYHTFTLMHREHHRVHNPLVAQRTEDAIQQDLINKGYRRVTNSDEADFSVDFTVGSRERTDINSYPTPYAGMGWGWGPGWWGYPYWGSDIDVRRVREGTLSVDVFDAHTHRPVWHGWAKKDLTERDIDQSEGPIRNAVAAILAGFPPR